MAIQKKAKVEEKKIDYVIEVTRAKELENGTIMFDMVANGVQIYGCSYKVLSRKDGSGDFVKIGFPSKKGSDDKYYNQAYFTMTEDIIQQIEKGIEAKLA